MRYLQPYLKLINHSHPLNNSYPIELCSLQLNYSPIQLESRVAKLVMNCIEQLNYHNDIALVSGYRSNQEQVELYQQSLHDNGLEYTRKYVAKPGCSEHESGLAIDIGTFQESIDFIAPEFDYNEKNNLIRQCLFCNGFIQRYPKHKVNITGIDHEPWHFRYVGKIHAAYMQQHDLCLEEYIELLRSTSIECPLFYQNTVIYQTNVIDPYLLQLGMISDTNAGFYIVSCPL